MASSGAACIIPDSPCTWRIRFKMVRYHNVTSCSHDQIWCSAVIRAGSYCLPPAAHSCQVLAVCFPDPMANFALVAVDRSA